MNARPDSAAAAGHAGRADDDFNHLLQREFRPRSDEARQAVASAVRTFAQQALARHPGPCPDIYRAIETLIAALDGQLSAHINQILHHPDFIRLEAAWRGLHHLVNETETDEMLKIRVLDVGKADLARSLRRYKGAAWDQSPIFRKIYLGLIIENTEYAGWRALRESEDARYLGLAMPRFLARLPYGPQTQPVEAFDFQEDLEGADHEHYVWANSAYAMACNITRAFKRHGWCTAIRGVESGGAVDHLPLHSFPTDEGGIDHKCPTEIAISDRRESELARAGLMPLVHRKHSHFAAFIGAQSLQKPLEYDDPAATANARLAARLPYLFASCRFAHYLKCIVRDKVGAFVDADAMRRALGDWIGQYVVSNPESAGLAVQAAKPLSAAEVTVDEIAGNPGHYQATFLLRPHFQLEGMSISLRLVSRLPSRRDA